MFDEQPDGDPHGECAAEIARLNARITGLECLLFMPVEDPEDTPLGKLQEEVAILRQVVKECEHVGDVLKDNGHAWAADRILRVISEVT